MTDQYFAPRRALPLQTSFTTQGAAENTPENNSMQQFAPALTSVKQKVSPSPEDFTISVDQVREHFRANGLSKSKDTVQRWCRNGDLTCQKRGVLGRYFTTEASLLKLEQKLLPDMIAENAGTKSALRNDLPVHAAVDVEERGGVQAHEAEDAGASSDMQPDAQVHASERSPAITQDADAARLSAEVEGLRAQLENRDKQIEFLQEEIRSGREQRGAVVQISNRMLETLETMAIGGRIDRSRQQGSAPTQSPEPVHAEHREPPPDGV